MASHSSIDLDQSNYSIKEAAALIGKSPQTVRRYLKDGLFPAARLRPGAKGDEYRISAHDLGALIEDKGLVLNLVQAEDQSEPSPSALLSDLSDAHKEIGQLVSQVAIADADRQRLQRDRDQARSDIEHERSQHQQTKRLLTDAEQRVAVAEARTEEVRQQLDSLDQKVHEIENQSAEALSAASKDHDELAAQLATAEASLGWWAKRRYKRDQ